MARGVAPLLLSALALVVAACAGDTAATSTRPGASSPDPVPVFYLQPAARADTLVAYDWSGSEVRTVRTAAPITCCTVAQSPDGSRLFSGDDILDGAGAVIARTSSPGTWASDNRHWCADVPEHPARPFSGPGLLEVLGPRPGDVRRVGTAGGFVTHGQPQIVSCDLTTETAVVAESAMGSVREVERVDLETGTATGEDPNLSRWGCGSGAGPVSAVAGNGSVVADGGSICSARSGKVLGWFTGQAEALSLSGRLVVTLSAAPPFPFGSIQVVDWRSHSTLLRIPVMSDTAPWVAALDQPDGNGLLLTVTTEPAPGTGTADAWLVVPGRTARHVASGVVQGVD